MGGKYSPIWLQLGLLPSTSTRLILLSILFQNLRLILKIHKRPRVRQRPAQTTGYPAHSAE
jgi:hypothetical protein